MKRRAFIKGVLGLAVAPSLPVTATSHIVPIPAPEYPPAFMRVARITKDEMRQVYNDVWADAARYGTGKPTPYKIMRFDCESKSWVMVL